MGTMMVEYKIRGAHRRLQVGSIEQAVQMYNADREEQNASGTKDLSEAVVTDDGEEVARISRKGVVKQSG